MLGGYHHVKGAMQVSTNKVFVYNEFNNAFLCLSTLQSVLIQYNGLTLEECGGTVVFVMKLDEC